MGDLFHAGLAELLLLHVGYGERVAGSPAAAPEAWAHREPAFGVQFWVRGGRLQKYPGHELSAVVVAKFENPPSMGA
jgi:hypothetical protein